MPEAGEPIDRLRAAATALALAERALTDRVREARAAGHSWADVGAVLGTSRQAAFKRFGVVRDPRTGQPAARTGTADVVDLTEQVFAWLDAGRHDELRGLMPDDVARVLTRDVLLGVWARVVADTGRLVRCEGITVQLPGGEPAPDAPLLGTVVGVCTLVCEAGEWEGRVAFGGDRRLLGLLVVPPGATGVAF